MKGIFVNLIAHKLRKPDLEEVLKALPVRANFDSGEEEPNISEEEMRYNIHQDLGHGYDDFHYNIITPIPTGNVKGIYRYVYDPDSDPNGELKWESSYFSDQPAIIVIFRGNGYILCSKE